jgi:hypothetical protein
MIALVLFVAISSIAFVAILPLASAAQAQSSWPMFHHDLRHTGLSQYDTSANVGALKWAFATGYLGGLLAGDRCRWHHLHRI